MLYIVERSVIPDDFSILDVMDSLPSQLNEPSRTSSNDNTQTPPTIEALLLAINKLTQELSDAKTEIDNLKAETSLLKEQLQKHTSPHPNNTQDLTELDFPLLGTDLSIHAPANRERSPWHQPSQVQQLKASMTSQKHLEQKTKRKAAAARFFQPPSPTQGFKYLYLSTKARLPVGKLRNLFRKLEINNNRILDIHYPDRHIIALLTHNDYEPELRE
jgi:hypothetical protein